MVCNAQKTVFEKKYIYTYVLHTYSQNGVLLIIRGGCISKTVGCRVFWHEIKNVQKGRFTLGKKKFGPLGPKFKKKFTIVG